MVSSVFSQAMAIPPKGILAHDEHLPEMESPRRIRFVGVWSQKKIICELSKKKKVKVDYVILFFKFKFKNMAKFSELGFVQWDPSQV